VSWVQTGFSQLVLSVVTLFWWQTLSGSLMKNGHHISTKQHMGIKSGVLQSKNSTISTSVWKWSFWAFLWLQWWNFNSLSSINQIKFAINAEQLFSKSVSTGCDKPVCTCGTLWRQHYVTTSKECLNKSHILSKYFELVFLQLHLIKILCILIVIWLNYKRKKKGAFLWNNVHKHCVRKKVAP